MAINFNNVTDIMLGQNQVTQIEDSLGNVLWSATPAVEYFYVEDISGFDNTLSIVKNNADAPTIEVFKSTNMSTWESMGITSTTAITATVPANGKLYLKAVCDRWGNDTKYNTISASGNHNVGGNSMSLLYGDNFQNQTTFPTNNTYMFTALFGGDTHLKNAEDLEMPAETLVFACYYQMFKNCTGLVTAPTTLPAMTMTSSAYREMFQGCTSLTTAPELPATTMNISCYQSMFERCLSLTTAPELPATTMANNCYNNIFKDCTSLTTAPALPATTMAQYCYGNMFYGCTHLTTAPALPATTLARECYRGMFYNCTSLTTAPALPATTLSSSCYRVMFYNCTSLTTAPALPATTLAQYCYYNMFYGCTHLTSVITYANDISATDCLNNWLMSVATTGDFYNLGSATYTADSASGIPTGWIERTALPEYFYVENVSNDTATVSFNAGSDTTINIKVSTDKSNWVDLGLITNAPTYSLPAGDKLYISATGDTWNFATIKCNKSFNVGGYIMSLLKGDNFSTNNHFSNERTTQFGGIFGDNNTLISANNLILATNTDYHCYQWMFAGCTSLTASPVLSAATLVDSCYSYMFYGCTSLNSVTIYAKDSTGGCNNWLYNVAATGDFYNLGGATYESGASGIPTGWIEHTALPEYFYVEDISGQANTLSITKNNASAPTIEVFKSTDQQNWTSMGTTSTTAITATIPANGKLYLKATANTWGVYQYGYHRVTANHQFIYTADCNVGGNLKSLLFGDDFDNDVSFGSATFAYLLSNNKIHSAKNLVLPNQIAEGCYWYMFSGCTALTEAPELPATRLSDDCYSTMFYNCTSLTTAPTLPATRLATKCYQNMFYGCTSLTTAPALPATTLVDSCYYNMFNGCTHLTSVITYADNISASNCLNNWLNGVAATGDFYNLGGATYESGASGIPAGWTEHTSL